jgi:pimeloyl-ACP methyl ester carboxylesterase
VSDSAAVSGGDAGASQAGGSEAVIGRRMVADVVGHGPAVVLLHGQPGSGEDWVRVADLLEGSFTLVAPDRPGYGRTGGAATGFAGNAQAVVELLDRLELDRFIAVGHSWGGGVALALAELQPERVAGLVLAASVGPGEPVGWDDRLLAAPVLGEAVAALTIGATGRLLGIDRVQSLADQRLAGRTLEAVKALTRLTGARTGSRVWQSFVTEQRALLAELDDLGPGLAALRIPVAVINGSADRVVRPSVGGMLSRAIPGATQTVLPGAHHLLPLDHPEAIADAVRDVHQRAGRPSSRDDPQGSSRTNLE